MANNEQDGIAIRTVSLYPQDWKEVDKLAQAMGVSASAALRIIIREWREKVRSARAEVVI